MNKCYSCPIKNVCLQHAVRAKCPVPYEKKVKKCDNHKDEK